MIGRQRVITSSWPRTIDDLISVGSQTTEGDGVTIMPSFDKEKNVDRLIPSYLENVVEFVGDRSDVEAAEDTPTTSDSRMAIYVDPANGRRSTNSGTDGRPVTYDDRNAVVDRRKQRQRALTTTGTTTSVTSYANKTIYTS
jgi:hypothetical protein